MALFATAMQHYYLILSLVIMSTKECWPVPISSRNEPRAHHSSWISSDCKQHWFENQVDHFNWGPTPLNISVWKQRYFSCDGSWQKPTEGKVPGPIFFYCGNEAPVDLYVNYTGFMYETAPIFGALLIFAEHRYYGESFPFGKASLDHLQYLTHEQVAR
jgi:lysosomal Pro-X carboxypeptidase